MTEALLINIALLSGLMLLLWRVAVRIDDVSFIDAVWAGGMGVLALLSWLQVPQGAGVRAHLLTIMVVVWAARLALHLLSRWRSLGEDARYRRILGKARQRGQFARAALTMVFAPQAVLLFVTCLPAQLGVLASPSPSQPGLLAVMGVGVWGIGMAFEAIGDWQLARFRADPQNKGKVLDTGLWRYTRHPNYFGDAGVWGGIWITAAEAGTWVALASLIGPLFLTFTLTRWSGKPMLERGMNDRRPGYADYVARTSGFVPWLPRSPRSSDLPG